jgi:hypothetical protein
MNGNRLPSTRAVPRKLRLKQADDDALAGLRGANRPTGQFLDMAVGPPVALYVPPTPWGTDARVARRIRPDRRGQRGCAVARPLGASAAIASSRRHKTRIARVVGGHDDIPEPGRRTRSTWGRSSGCRRNPGTGSAGAGGVDVQLRGCRTALVVGVIVVVQIASASVAGGAMAAPRASSHSSGRASSRVTRTGRRKRLPSTAHLRARNVRGAKVAPALSEGRSTPVCRSSSSMPRSLRSMARVPATVCGAPAHERLPSANRVMRSKARMLRRDRLRGPPAKRHDRSVGPDDLTGPGGETDGLLQPDWQPESGTPTPPAVFGASSAIQQPQSTEIMFGGYTASGLTSATWGSVRNFV